MLRKHIVYVLILWLLRSSFAQLYEGDTCWLSANETGTCVHLSKCPSAMELIKKCEHPPRCGFAGIIPIVCCLSVTNLLRTSISETQCETYKKIGAEDNFFYIEVFGGVDAKPGEFPHMASLGYNDQEKIVWFCGGSLISEKFVLTAAHCLNSQQYGALQWARFGILQLSDPDTNSSEKEIFSVTRRIPHPQYKLPNRYHDIALLELSKAVELSLSVKPACLPINTIISTEDTLIATGWGLVKQDGELSDTLQKVDLSMTEEETCEKLFPNNNKLKQGIQHKFMFCAGGRKEDGIKDTCPGDSGGPLQIKKGKSFTVVGITSFGKTCGYAPGVYTKVETYVSWIESVVWFQEK